MTSCAAGQYGSSVSVTVLFSLGDTVVIVWLLYHLLLNTPLICIATLYSNLIHSKHMSVFLKGSSVFLYHHRI